MYKNNEGGRGVMSENQYSCCQSYHNCFLNTPTWQFFFTSVTIIKKPTIPPPLKKKLSKIMKGICKAITIYHTMKYW